MMESQPALPSQKSEEALQSENSQKSYILATQSSEVKFKSVMGGAPTITKRVIDPRNLQKLYDSWKLRNKDGISGISKGNSKIILQYLSDMERGINISKNARKGKRGPARLKVLAFHLKELSIIFEKRYKKNLINLTREEVHDVFDDFKNGKITRRNGHPYRSAPDFARDFISFWNWYMKVNGLKGKAIINIVEYLERGRHDNTFVYFTFDALKQVLSHLNENDQVLSLFLFDSIVRSPSELTNLFVSDLTFEDDEVWVNIREEVSKTFARKFNLVLCGDKIKKYIERNELTSKSQLFPFYYERSFNLRLQKAFVKVFGDVMTRGGKSFSEITGYSFRHSGCCYLRAKKINLDTLMIRGGWKGLKRINYYSKFLGLDGKISKDQINEEESTVNKNLMKLIETQNQEILELKEKLAELLAKKMASGVKVEENGEAVQET